MRSRLAALALSLGCSGARSRATPPVAPTARVERAEPARAGWSVVAPRDRPPRIDRVAALSDGSMVILSGSGVFGVSARAEVRPSCAIDSDLVVGGLHASGSGWWALAGEAFSPAVFHGGAGAAGCARVALPPLVARNTPPGQLRSAQSGADSLVWSSAGPIARSRDGAHTWQRIPPLPEVVAMAASGATLYAAALLGSPSSRTPFNRHGYDVFSLPEGETRWTLSPTPGDRAAPVALLPREEGGVLGLDALGGFEINAHGDGRVGASTGPHFARDRPRLLVGAAPDSAIGLSEGMLSRHRLSGWRPLPTLPEERAATAFDAAPDGSIVVSDGRELWRVREAEAPTVLLRTPLGGGRPTRLAASGAVIAALTGPNRLSVSRDGGETWTDTVIPTEAGGARSLSVLPGGVVAVITAEPPSGAGALPTGALWVLDSGLHRIELPTGARVFESGASLHAIGDRWILLAGDVLVSDDQGAHWRPTLGAPRGSGDGWGVVSLAAASGRTAWALDSAGALWRSDDAGDQFVSISPGRPTEGAAALRQPQPSSDWLRWDGGDALLASVGRQLIRFDREGRGAPLGTVRGAVFGAAVEGGAVIATSAVPSGAVECGRDGEPLLMAASSTGTLFPIPAACDHRAVAWALDGDALYTVDADGLIERASLRGLWREAIESGPP